ncbi:MAG: lycopene cyclase domain-containing protein [Spirochaetia bacterium]|nr:lycopene cyclase domain-containing protein [Spirochaetia bacterium]
MNLYLIITLAVIAAPLALSFDRRVAFHTRWRQVFISMLPVSALYIFWDVLVTERGDWAFNPSYAGTFRLFGLPLGEWLFFIVVPYACLFILEVVKAYFPRKRHENRTAVIRIGIGSIVLFLLLAFLFKDQHYTVLAMLSMALWIGLSLLFTPHIFHEIHTLWFFLLSTIAFLLVNGVLTYLPIVTYNPAAVWGFRIVSIPLEDLFYNIGMLGCYLMVYDLYGRHLGKEWV